MQSGEQVERAAYSCVLRSAEEHEDPPHPDGGVCGLCAEHRPLELSDELSASERAALDGCCLCVECPSYPVVVSAHEWHEWDECWRDF